MYYISSASISWEEANINCTNLGGHLVTISSSEENELVWNATLNNGLNPGGTNNYQSWIGLYQNTRFRPEPKYLTHFVLGGFKRIP